MTIRVEQPLFPEVREFLANYDYFDVADGVGYKVYYGAMANNGSYIVTPNQTTYSEKIKTLLSNESIDHTADVKKFDLDFDLTFNTPKNIKGDIFINVPVGLAAVNTNSRNFNYYVVVKAYHYDGSTETQIGSTATSVTLNAALDSDAGLPTFTDNCANVFCLKITSSSITHFKAGEILRFTIEGWFKCTSGATNPASIAIGHDPANRADSKVNNWSSDESVLANGEQGGTIYYLPTQMNFQVPFKLDIEIT